MKQLAGLAWKEWHETRAFLWIALGVFVGLPVIAALEGLIQYSRRFEASALPWVALFGGVLAIFVAVGATCRDFGGRLEDFWQSRPVSVARWLAIKYAVGLAVVLLACSAPLFLDLSTKRNEYWGISVACVIAVLPAFFSLGFLAGCLVRRAAHAAMLALAGMLLIYFLPAIVPPLNWLAVANIESLAEVVQFATGMIAIALIASIIAFVATTHGWRVESGRKMMYGAVGLAILILFWSAAYQLGTNIPVLKEISLPKDEAVELIRCEGNWGYVITRRMYEVPATRPEEKTRVDWEYRSLEVTESGLHVGEKQDANRAYGWFGWQAVSPPGHPEIAYGAWVNDESANPMVTCDLGIRDLKRNSFDRMQLWKRPGRTWNKSGRYGFGFSYCYALENRLYVVGPQLITLDITDPDKPKVISSIPFDATAAWGDLSGLFNGNYWAFVSNGNVEKKLDVLLDPIPGLAPRQRLDAMMDAVRTYRASTFDGTIWCRVEGDGLLAYRLVKLTESNAVFDLVGQYSPSILETVFGRMQYRQIEMANGLVYVSDQASWSPMIGGEQFNPHVSVFDVKGPGPIRLVGHFAAPGAGVAFPLADGRTLVGGSKLWLVGPPPGYAGK